MSHVHRHALVRHSAARMYALVNDVDAYPRIFSWCEGAEVLERGEDHMVARLSLRLGAIRSGFTTRNTLVPDRRIQLDLVDGPFRSLQGVWEFQALDEQACKVSLTMDFETSSRLIGRALEVGFKTMADRMVGDFIRAADASVA
ncbi:type II toxin-antitoxin system RatA family toxin [Coralloluteibacterium stylophorae]|uniref:Type II toxin-antitoxin system RatA family toxin n=1 Tax=Coralloluteibacterium stylophorae TaxID=1776034 RepID=A0AAP2FYK8_9GAMM|nr:type II toxin-antitoxin system RatA family toxin [Coralloluteibacterium stylophorae]MBS7455940.1 type II toxin-antitoxin system RatA family toxin [Coralloluteibacterium stylophorae]